MRPIWTIVLMVLYAGAVTGLPAQTLTTLHGFAGPDGEYPSATLIQGWDGNLYGATQGGPTTATPSTVFKMTPSGLLIGIYAFCQQIGCPGSAYSALIQASNGNFYGTTIGGGANKYGMVFEITSDGSLTTLYSFCSQSGCTDGANPTASLIQGMDGNLYGTTQSGGSGAYCPSSLSTLGCGTIFKITLGGSLTTLHRFCSQSGCPDGAFPIAGLIQATDMNFYGTTFYGGNAAYCPNNTWGCGTVFKIAPTGSLTTIYKFCSQSACTDGDLTYAGLVEAADGNLYGTTYYGGTYNNGAIFKITPHGTYTTLYNFCDQFSGCPGGAVGPNTALVQATDGNLYGTTYYGGTYDYGTIFKITTGGSLTNLYDFCSQSNCGDGDSPLGGLVQDTSGLFYGTTSGGGGYSKGTIFSLSVGLGPFVTFARAAGKVGQTCSILGQGFIGATSVMLNGVPANFKIISDTFIKATVPQGATTGYVTVTTPGGVLRSNVLFRVIP